MHLCIQATRQPHLDVANFFDAHGVRHRVFVPLKRISKAAQSFRGFFPERKRHDRIAVPVRHENRGVLRGRICFMRKAVRQRQVS